MSMLQDNKGNALFLILIAVALFAALSYAVTQSGRSGGGVERESLLIESGKMVQYSSSVRDSLLRLILTGTAETNLLLDVADVGEDALFSTEGGGAIKPDTSYGTWTVGGIGDGISVQGVGTPDEDIVIYALMNFSQGNLCTTINDQLGLSPNNNSDTDGDLFFEAYPGEPVGCFGFGFGVLYYHVLKER